MSAPADTSAGRATVTHEAVFEEALGLEWPWYIRRTILERKTRTLSVHLDFESGGTFTCGGCAIEECKAYDTTLRRWRHLDFLGNRTLLYAPAPRVKCPRCGIRQSQLSWARSRQRLTVSFEEFVVDLAREMPIQAVSRILGEHDTRLRRVVNRCIDADMPAESDG